MKTVIALDPGGTTGVVVAYGGLMQTHQVSGLTSVNNLLHNHNPNVVVYEKFFYQRRDKVDLTPVEVIGVIKLYCELTGTEIVGLAAQQAKVFWTDEKLKKLGLWETNHKHAMDAVRHLLYYITFGQGDYSYVERLKGD